MLVPVKENELLALKVSFRCAPNGEREQLLGAARFHGWKPPFPNEPLSEEGLELPILLQVAANMANGVDPTLGSSCDHKKTHGLQDKSTTFPFVTLQNMVNLLHNF